MAVREGILNILHVTKHYFGVAKRIASYFSKKISVRGFFKLASQFLTAVAEETTKKAYISYKLFPRVKKLFLEHYPG